MKRILFELRSCSDFEIRIVHGNQTDNLYLEQRSHVTSIRKNTPPTWSLAQDDYGNKLPTFKTSALPEAMLIALARMKSHVMSFQRGDIESQHAKNQLPLHFD